MEWLRWILFGVVTLICILFFYYLRKERVLTNTFREAYEALDETAVKNAREEKRKQLLRQNNEQKGLGKLLEWPRTLYVYSGLNRIFANISFELWFVMILGTAVMLYFVALAITRSVSSGLILALLYVLLITVIEKLMAFRNYKRVDENMIEFLNILSNYSATNDEIISVFLQVSNYVQEPLKSALEECYYDAQTSGDKAAALLALANRIEHDKFKDFICNIEICVNYAGNFGDIIDQTRQIVRDDQKFRKEQKSLANSLIVNMFMVSAGLIAALGITDGLVSSSIWNLLFYQPIGQVALVFIGIIYALFFYMIATV